MRIWVTGNVFAMSRNMSYGGERTTLYLIEALVNLGHKVYVFAKEGSDFTGINIKDYIPVEPMNDRYDVHFKAACEYSERTGITPDVYFIGYFGKGHPEMFEKWPACEEVWCRWSHQKFEFNQPSFNVVSYSKRLQGALRQSGVPSTMIHYGVPEDLYRCVKNKDDYAVWIGKIEAGKAPQLAIQLAKAAGLKIVLMGPPYNTSHFWQLVHPYIDNERVFWVRGVDDQMKCEIMSKAKVFISSNDNTWCEDFGIVNIEALAMGTPIVAFNRINQDCAIVTDKIIEDGKHGFILNYKDSNNVQEILATGVPLIHRIHEIDPAACRQQFEKRFTADLMARRYEWLFEKIMQGERFGEVEVPFLIIDAQIETQPMGDNRVLDYLRNKGYHRCIDFGGVHRPWASKYVTIYVDLVRPEEWEKRYPGMYDQHPEIWHSGVIAMDCEDDATWDALEYIVDRDGKFDFAISTHMLEHLSNPGRFLEMLPVAADEGYIGIPNKIFELGRGREFTDEGIKRLGLTGSYRGAFPHRWIFTVKDDVLWAFPKLGSLEFVDLGWEDKLKHYEPLDLGQLGFFWEGYIPVRMITDKDIGFPNPETAIELYRNLLVEGL